MKRKKILGALYGAAYGDSLGAITEFCTHEEIIHHFPNGLRTYEKSISVITKDIESGCVTDDFGSSCYVMQEIINEEGYFHRDIALKAILAWSEDENVFKRYAGSNTKAAIERLKKGSVIEERDKLFHFQGKNTNGGAMKVTPIALLAKHDVSRVIQYTKDLCWPTHYNASAVSAAAAIACAIAQAQKETTIDSIIHEAIQGATKAWNEVSNEGYVTFGPRIENRIQYAVMVARKCTTDDELFSILNNDIGTGILVNESIPAVFAILAYTDGDFEKSMYLAVNAGGDTDTIASMLGAIVGGYHGIDVIPEEIREKINEKNQMIHLKETIETFTQMLLHEKEEEK
ncbi:ADP-ribosylglycohydrolase [Breznakia blatticola]|uniref:ADP-ribosylglycohydrolase n=1 Tax=Breznakia blatticola TaxID=1754012 RepID=A0A4R7ZCA5_9FIRM|nr:ADP-ribosylglycohydrolase family protein [Breznakia blatticola]TDW09483.1 ADP-ribosylglycohydrolase [Breznakia blatticola]